MIHRDSVHVELGQRSYAILIASDWLDQIGAAVRERGFKNREAMIITDTIVGDLYFARVEHSLINAGFSKVAEHCIPSGENGKNWDEYSRCCHALLAHFPDTGAMPLVFTLGGGVVGDLGGFAAGAFRRGVPYIQVPTTLLSAVDSSVGGKVAVNAGAVKNIFGMFYQPRLVFIDLSTLHTLSPREIRSGMAEVIKYGAVCSRALFEQLDDCVEQLVALSDVSLLKRVVADCCQLKADVVRQDEDDSRGIRNVLNFGHTIGHALESASEYQLTHGEAIAIGMIAETRLAVSLGKCGAEVLARIQSLIVRAGLPVDCRELLLSRDRVMRSLRSDKKFREGKNLFVLPTALGAWSPSEGVAQSAIDDAVDSVIS